MNGDSAHGLPVSPRRGTGGRRPAARRIARCPSTRVRRGRVPG